MPKQAMTDEEKAAWKAKMAAAKAAKRKAAPASKVVNVPKNKPHAVKQKKETEPVVSGADDDDDGYFL